MDRITLCITSDVAFIRTEDLKRQEDYSNLKKDVLNLNNVLLKASANKNNLN